MISSDEERQIILAEIDHSIERDLLPAQAIISIEDSKIAHQHSFRFAPHAQEIYSEWAAEHVKDAQDVMLQINFPMVDERPLSEVSSKDDGMLVKFKATLVAESMDHGSVDDTYVVEKNSEEPILAEEYSHAKHGEIIARNTIDCRHVVLEEKVKEDDASTVEPRRITARFYGIRNVVGFRENADILITGVYTPLPNKKRKMNEYIIHVVGARFLQDETLPTSEDIQRLKTHLDTLGRDKYIEWVVNGIVPHIRAGAAPYKLATLFAAIGGIAFNEERHNIHVGLFGPGGAGKSTIPRFLTTIDPRGIDLDASSISSRGITWAQVDGPNGEKFLTPGATVKYNYILMDEATSLPKALTDELKGVIEHQEANYHKALKRKRKTNFGLVITGNPKHENWNFSHSIEANLTLSKAMLSRFIIFYVPIMRESREDKVRKFQQSVDSDVHATVRDLRTLIIHCRPLIPSISSGAIDLLVDFTSAPITENTEISELLGHRRDALIYRLSGAFAKLFMLDSVDTDCVTRAIQMLDDSARSFQVNNTSNKMVQSDSKPNIFRALALGLVNSNPDGFEKEQIINEMVNSSKWVNVDEASNYFSKNSEHHLIRTGTKYKVIT